MAVDDTLENADRCLCPGCPTYEQCMEGNDQKLFCSRGDSQCDPEPKGCLCGECPVWTEYELTTTYFCIDGAAD